MESFNNVKEWMSEIGKYANDSKIWEPGSLGEKGIQSSSDERPANSAAGATDAEEQLLFIMMAQWSGIFQELG
uniref:Uncharacterized protein n=1 Tax=Leersia perrieri TaxID=77586 RepID=A0A0D9W5F1_9ORYZ